MNAEPPIFELWTFEQWYLKYHRYVGGLELQTTVWLGEHELNCLTCISSDSHFPTQESCTTHEFIQLLMIECCHHYIWPQNPAFPVDQSYSCWLSSSSVRDCGWNSWIDAVFVILAINATWKYIQFFSIF